MKRYVMTFENYTEAYFNNTIDLDVKKLSNEFTGRAVTWYGDPYQMIGIDKDYVDGMFGNIYDNDKLESVKQLINNSEDNVEFECSYAHGNVLNFTDIKEQQESVFGGNFGTDYDGTDKAASIGNEELDNYIGNEELDETELMSIETWDNSDLYDLLNAKRFSLIYNIEISTLDKEVQELDDLSENDLNYYKRFIEVERQLKEAVDNEDGDIGDFRIQLRDGHHRVMGAISSGEKYVCVNLAKDDIERFKDIIDKENYVFWVTNKFGQ
jgi:hypothetical protein